MAEITLMHEDIYIYIDEISNLTQHVGGSGTLTIVNDATGMKAHGGEMEITATSGSATAISLSCNGNTLTINRTVDTGQTLFLSLEKNYHTLNGTRYLNAERLNFTDNAVNQITVTVTGDANVEIDYTSNRVVYNNDSLTFCDSISYNSDFQRSSFVNVKGVTRFAGSEKRTYSWDINGLWNSEEFGKFDSGTGSFSIRLIDIDGGLLEILANCTINSIKKSSSDSSDYTYQISGNCLEIF